MHQKKKEIEMLINRYKRDILSLDEREEDLLRQCDFIQNLIPNILAPNTEQGVQFHKDNKISADIKEKMEHFKHALKEIQTSLSIVHEEKNVMLQRVNELELALTKQKDKNIDKTINKDISKTTPGQIMNHAIMTHVKEPEGMKSDRSNVKSDNEDKDWKTVCKNLQKQVVGLTENLNDSSKKLMESKDNVKKLEDKFSKLKKDLEAQIQLNEKTNDSPVTDTIENLEDNEEKSIKSGVQSQFSSKSQTVSTSDNKSKTPQDQIGASPILESELDEEGNQRENLENQLSSSHAEKWNGEWKAKNRSEVQSLKSKSQVSSKQSEHLENQHQPSNAEKWNGEWKAKNRSEVQSLESKSQASSKSKVVSFNVLLPKSSAQKISDSLPNGEPPQKSESQAQTKSIASEVLTEKSKDSSPPDSVESLVGNKEKSVKSGVQSQFSSKSQPNSTGDFKSKTSSDDGQDKNVEKQHPSTDTEKWNGEWKAENGPKEHGAEHHAEKWNGEWKVENEPEKHGTEHHAEKWNGEWKAENEPEKHGTEHHGAEHHAEKWNGEWKVENGPKEHGAEHHAEKWNGEWKVENGPKEHGAEHHAEKWNGEWKAENGPKEHGAEHHAEKWNGEWKAKNEQEKHGTEHNLSGGKKGNDSADPDIKASELELELLELEGLMHDENTDWKQVYEDLQKRISKLTDHLNNSQQKLAGSKDYVKNLEEKYNKLKEELEGKIDNLEKKAKSFISDVIEKQEGENSVVKQESRAIISGINESRSEIASIKKGELKPLGQSEKSGMKNVPEQKIPNGLLLKENSDLRNMCEDLQKQITDLTEKLAVSSDKVKHTEAYMTNLEHQYSKLEKELRAKIQDLEKKTDDLISKIIKQEREMNLKEEEESKGIITAAHDALAEVKSLRSALLLSQTSEGTHNSPQDHEARSENNTLPDESVLKSTESRNQKSESQDTIETETRIGKAAPDTVEGLDDNEEKSIKSGDQSLNSKFQSLISEALAGTSSSNKSVPKPVKSHQHASGKKVIPEKPDTVENLDDNEEKSIKSGDQSLNSKFQSLISEALAGTSSSNKSVPKPVKSHQHASGKKVIPEKPDTVENLDDNEEKSITSGDQSLNSKFQSLISEALAGTSPSNKSVPKPVNSHQHASEKKVIPEKPDTVESLDDNEEKSIKSGDQSLNSKFQSLISEALAGTSSSNKSVPKPVKSHQHASEKKVIPEKSEKSNILTGNVKDPQNHTEARRETETLISRYKADIAALEERKEDLMRHIEIFENLIPTVQVGYVWKMFQTVDVPNNKGTPVPQKEIEKAKKYLSHLEGVLDELKQAVEVIKIEEEIIKKRIDELETFLAHEPTEYASKATGIPKPVTLNHIVSKAQKTPVTLEYPSKNLEKSLQSENNDWENVYKNLSKEISDLDKNINESSKKLQDSEDYVRKLEANYSTLEKQLEEKTQQLKKKEGSKKKTPLSKHSEKEKSHQEGPKTEVSFIYEKDKVTEDSEGHSEIIEEDASDVGKAPPDLKESHTMKSSTSEKSAKESSSKVVQLNIPPKEHLHSHKSTPSAVASKHSEKSTKSALASTTTSLASVLAQLSKLSALSRGSLAIQTLQSKIQTKDHLIQSLADELRELARNKMWTGDQELEAVVGIIPGLTFDWDRTALLKYLEGEDPQQLFGAKQRSNQHIDENNPLNVKVKSKLGRDSLLVEWGPPPSPDTVGFQVYLNGEFKYWTHATNHNIILLQPLDLKKKVEISVSPIDVRGNAVHRSSIVYKPA